MPNIHKWNAPATSGEVTRALLEIRTAMIGLYALIHSAKNNNPDGIAEATKKYLEADAKLGSLIDEIGGLK